LYFVPKTLLHQPLCHPHSIGDNPTPQIPPVTEAPLCTDGDTEHVPVAVFYNAVFWVLLLAFSFFPSLAWSILREGGSMLFFLYLIRASARVRFLPSLRSSVLLPRTIPHFSLQPALPMEFLFFPLFQVPTTRPFTLPICVVLPSIPTLRNWSRIVFAVLTWRWIHLPKGL